MSPVPLAEFVSTHGQSEAAKALGATQAAISKAARSGRHIFVQKKPCGAFEAVELRGFPSGGESKSRLDLDSIVSVIAPIAQPLSRADHPSSISQALG
ncbi:Cro/CI family transcriptional regulator [Pseudomonas cichorii]|uniref:Cro/CI family transcriptional regulator n=1 Tax=Pseudomonas cichorii TaxID=36746 RepID=UPI000942C98D|nr:Cro/CI family transcriptional regulator [Pseudomonas cichorii]QVE15712.1 hypothetical protein KGD89_17705 [Pseudomonas cichorii]